MASRSVKLPLDNAGGRNPQSLPGRLFTPHPAVQHRRRHRGLTRVSSTRYLVTLNRQSPKRRSSPFLAAALYRNQPPDLPDALVFRSYCSKPAARIGLVGGLNPASSLKTWNDLFGLEPDGPSGKLSVLDILAESYHKGETLACQSITSENLFPRDWQSQIDIRDPEKPENSVTVLVEGIWRIYQGVLSAHLLRGSYSIIDQEFLGQQSGPCIDLWGPPGAHWTLIEERPQWTGSSILNCILRRGKFKEALVQHYGPQILMPSP